MYNELQRRRGHTLGNWPMVQRTLIEETQTGISENRTRVWSIPEVVPVNLESHSSNRTVLVWYFKFLCLIFYRHHSIFIWLIFILWNRSQFWLAAHVRVFKLESRIALTIPFFWSSEKLLSSNILPLHSTNDFISPMEVFFLVGHQQSRFFAQKALYTYLFAKIRWTTFLSMALSKVKFTDRYPHWYTRRVKEAIHIRLHPNNINRDSGIDFPEAWMPTVKQHNSRFMRTYEGTPSNDRNNNEDWNASVTAYQRTTNSDTKTIDLIAWWRLAVLQSKRRNLHHKWLSWDKRTKFISYLIPRWTISTYYII